MKTIFLITGATSGIGSFVSHYFAAKGATLILHGRDQEKLARLQSELDGQGHFLLNADFQDLNSISLMADSLVAFTDHIDVLINNAFGKLEEPLEKTSSSELAEFFQVSVAGTADVIRTCIPLLQQSISPHIVNIVADWGFPMHNIMTGPSAYIAAKYAIHGLGVALQTELSPYGIRTTTLCPGVVAADVKFGTSYEDFLEEFGNEAIHPGDLANSIEFVIKQRSAHVKSIVLSPNNPGYNGL